MNESEAWIFAVSLKKISDEIERHKEIFWECQMVEYCYPNEIFKSLESLFQKSVCFRAFIEQTCDIRLINKIRTCSLHALVDLALHCDNSIGLAYSTKICSAFEEIISWCIHFSADSQLHDADNDGDERPEIPEELKTEKAKFNLKIAVDAGLLNDDYSPTELIKTLPQKALLAEIISERAGIKKKWKPFEALWGVKNLAQERHRSKEAFGKVTGGEPIMKAFKEK